MGKVPNGLETRKFHKRTFNDASLLCVAAATTAQYIYSINKYICTYIIIICVHIHIHIHISIYNVWPSSSFQRILNYIIRNLIQKKKYRKIKKKIFFHVYLNNKFFIGYFCYFFFCNLKRNICLITCDMRHDFDFCLSFENNFLK